MKYSRDIENKGWDKMQKILANEMPKRKKPFLWLWAAAAIIPLVMIGYLTYNNYTIDTTRTNDTIAFNQQNEENTIPNKILTNTNVELKEKTKTTKAIISETTAPHTKQHNSIPNKQSLSQNTTLNNNGTTWESKNKTSNFVLTKNKISKNENKPQTKEVTIPSEEITKINSTNNVINNSIANNIDWKQKKEETITKERQVNFSNINLIPLRNSIIKNNKNIFVINKSIDPTISYTGNWNLMLDLYFNYALENKSFGYDLGLNLTYAINQRFSLGLMAKYIQSKFNHERSEATKQSPSGNSNNNIDDFLLDYKGIELYITGNYQFSNKWLLSTSIGIAPFSSRFEQLSYDYNQLYKSNNSDIKFANEAPTYEKFAIKTEETLDFNRLITLARLDLKYLVTKNFSLNIGYTKYFNPFIKQSNNQLLDFEESTISGSRLSLGVGYIF